MKYLVTGGSGYIGTRLVRLLSERDDSEVVVCDIRPPAALPDRARFAKVDVRDRAMGELIEAERPDALIHLAFVLNPIHSERTMYEIDVNGTENVLTGAARAGTEHVMVASSTTAYGAWPDNPVPLTEEHPVRGLPGYQYAREKTEVDRLSQLWAAQHPDRLMTIFRPCIVYGPNVNNYLIRFWKNAPFVPLVDGLDLEWQFVHEDDLVRGVAELATQRVAGIFNITGDGTVKFSEIADMLGLKTRKLSARTYRLVTQIAWRLHLPRVEAPGGQVEFTRYPWIASNQKLKEQTGWQPEYTSLETLEITLRANGILKNPPLRQEQPAEVGVAS